MLLDFTLKREFYEAAKGIVSLAVNGNIQAFITPSIVHITGYWLTKAYGGKKAKELLLTLLLDVRVIDASHETVLKALQSGMDDMEDALQYFTALQHKLDFFISQDRKLKNAALPALPVYGPEEFLKERK